MNLAVIIPALNEVGCIGDLVRATRAQPVSRVIVVDNASTDGTAEAARHAGAEVILAPARGYGSACMAGVAAARDADVLVFLDGDFSFAPSEIPRLLAPITDETADLVLGSRPRGGIAPGAMPPHQRFGNRLVSRLISLLYGVQLTDLGPFRAVRRALLDELNLREPTYGFPTEMIIKAARRHARIVEVPVTYAPRRAGKSKVSSTVRGSVAATLRILNVTLRYAREKEPAWHAEAK